MPGLDGIAVAEKLVTELPACGSLILTSYGRPGHLKRALAAGVRGFLPKTVSAQVLADVVRTVHRGGRYVDPELAADAISAGDSPLTPREADVLELAAGGAPVDEIAKRAALTPAQSATTSPRQPPSSAPPTATKRSSSPAPAAGSDSPARPHPPHIPVCRPCRDRGRPGPERTDHAPIRLRDDPPGRPCRVEAGWEDHNMGVRRVVPDLSSTSLEAAKGFYGDVLGLRPVMDQGWIVTSPILNGRVPRSAS